jgi:serine/threonine-protein kinase
MTNGALEQSWKIPSPGETLAGKYVVDGRCGRGGLAVVLSAVHVGLAQKVAIKMLLPEWAGDKDVMERFAREGRAAIRIRSEHVVRVLDVDSLATGAPYLVLEYLEGHDLEEIVALWGPPPVRTAIDWVLQAAEAISEAHVHGIVHRDLKPANLFLTTRADGSACIKVIDFGLSKLTDPFVVGTSAKLTRPTDVLGSPHYMAPEQLRAAGDAGPRVDLWGLGAVLHELLTGQPPFRGDTMPELCAAVLTQPPPPLRSIRSDVPAEVERAVLCCLEKDPSERFASAADLARALAPFGTESAHVSLMRIERVIATGGRPSLQTPLPVSPAGLRSERVSRPSDRYPTRHADPASPRIALGSLSILAGLGVGSFLWMHSLVHAGEPPPNAVRAAPPELVATSNLGETTPSETTPSETRAAAPIAPSVVAAAAATVSSAGPAKPLAVRPRNSDPAPAPKAHSFARPRAYKVEPGVAKVSSPDRASGPGLPASNPYGEPPAVPAPTTAVTVTPAEPFRPAHEPVSAPTEDPFDSRK